MRRGFSQRTSLFLIMGILFPIASNAFAFDIRKAYTYQYMKKGVEIGTEVFFLEKKGRRFIMKSDIIIEEANSYQRGSSELVFRKKGKPLAYSRHLDVKLPQIPAQNGLWILEYVFHDKKVTGEVTKDGSPQWKGTVEVEKGRLYCIDNNALSLLAILVQDIYPELKSETIYSVKAFHFSEARVRDVIFSKVKDGTYRCRIGRMDVGDLTIRYGILLKHEDPTRELAIRLKQ
ncbi:MAG: hypothetical protein JSW70_02005 [Syntrophobacterales bacterium]|nr:MAG: hypothetical protein JSW70_02005 [Syntrophobacterales bacterium]